MLISRETSSLPSIVEVPRCWSGSRQIYRGHHLRGYDCWTAAWDDHRDCSHLYRLPVVIYGVTTVEGYYRPTLVDKNFLTIEAVSFETAPDERARIPYVIKGYFPPPPVALRGLDFSGANQSLKVSQVLDREAMIAKHGKVLHQRNL